LKDVTWVQALDTILEIKGFTKKVDGNVVKVMTMGKADIESLPTRVVKINYSDAKKLKDNILKMLKKDPADKSGKAVIGSVEVDEHSNSLIIRAVQDDMVKLLAVIEKIDKPTPQILIKANIVETTKDTARNLGIQWGGLYANAADRSVYAFTPGGTGTGTPGKYNPTSGSTGIGEQGFAVNFPAAMSATASSSLGLIFGTLGGNILELQLSAMQKDGKLRILSSPSITTMDNQMAFTENGEKVPYVTTEVSGGAITKVVKFEEAVLRLEITPHVVDEKNLKMKVVVKKDEVDTSRNVDGNPYIIKKQTETNLIVQDGETIFSKRKRCSLVEEYSRSGMAFQRGARYRNHGRGSDFHYTEYNGPAGDIGYSG